MVVVVVVVVLPNSLAVVTALTLMLMSKWMAPKTPNDHHHHHRLAHTLSLSTWIHFALPKFVRCRFLRRNLAPLSFWKTCPVCACVLRVSKCSFNLHWITYLFWISWNPYILSRCKLFYWYVKNRINSHSLSLWL